MAKYVHFVPQQSQLPHPLLITPDKAQVLGIAVEAPPSLRHPLIPCVAHTQDRQFLTPCWGLKPHLITRSPREECARQRRNPTDRLAFGVRFLNPHNMVCRFLPVPVDRKSVVEGKRVDLGG